MRTAPVAIAVAVAVITATGVGVAVAADRDDVRPVDALSLGAVEVDDAGQEPATGTTSTGAATADRTPLQVEGLDQLQGVLTRADGDDADDRAEFEIAGVDLDLGPDAWLLDGATLADYDGNGTLQPVVEELEALLGQDVTVAGRYEVEDRDDDFLDRVFDGSSDDDMDVYVIQDLAFRDTAGGPAPWASAGATSSSDNGDDLATGSSDLSPEQREQLTQVALEAVGAGSRIESLEREDDDGATWEVDVIDASGIEQHVLLDAAGAVIDVRPED